MPGRHSREVDYHWASAGDYFLDLNSGDFRDTKNEKLRSLAQRVIERVSSGGSDWEGKFPVANLSRFRGRPNTAELGEEIKRSVTAALVTGDLLWPNEVQVEVFPISKHEIALVVIVRPTGQRQQLFLNFTYSATDNKVVPRNV